MTFPTIPYQFEVDMDMEDQNTEKSECEKAKALLTGYLNERMRVTISDGRVIDGRLICTDRDCNLVLSNCEEFLSGEEMSEFDGQGIGSASASTSGGGNSPVCARQPRTLSMAIVPGEHIRSILLARQQKSPEHSDDITNQDTSTPA